MKFFLSCRFPVYNSSFHSAAISDYYRQPRPSHDYPSLFYYYYYFILINRSLLCFIYLFNFLLPNDVDIPTGQTLFKYYTHFISLSTVYRYNNNRVNTYIYILTIYYNTYIYKRITDFGGLNETGLESPFKAIKSEFGNVFIN